MRPAILILEDDDLLRRAYARMIAGKGCRPVEAATIEQAHACCGEPIDAWLIDQILPDGFGIDVLRGLRTKGSNAPALVVSALSGEESIALAGEAADLGAPCHAKPVSEGAIDALLEAAHRALPLDIHLGFELALTRREHEVITCRVEGVTRPGIAAALGITEDAVKSRVRSVLRKATRQGYACDDLDDLLVDAERRRRG